MADPGRKVRGRFIYFIFMVARCPIFSRTVQYFGPLSGIRMIIIPDNASVNIVQYFVQPTLTLSMSGIFERATCMATLFTLSVATSTTLTNHILKLGLPGSSPQNTGH